MDSTKEKPNNNSKGWYNRLVRDAMLGSVAVAMAVSGTSLPANAAERQERQQHAAQVQNQPRRATAPQRENPGRNNVARGPNPVGNGRERFQDRSPGREIGRNNRFNSERMLENGGDRFGRQYNNWHNDWNGNNNNWNNNWYNNGNYRYNNRGYYGYNNWNGCNNWDNGCAPAWWGVVPSIYPNYYGIPYYNQPVIVSQPEVIQAQPPYVYTQPAVVPDQSPVYQQGPADQYSYPYQQAQPVQQQQGPDNSYQQSQPMQQQPGNITYNCFPPSSSTTENNSTESRETVIIVPNKDVPDSATTKKDGKERTSNSLLDFSDNPYRAAWAGFGLLVIGYAICYSVGGGRRRVYDDALLRRERRHPGGSRDPP